MMRNLFVTILFAAIAWGVGAQPINPARWWQGKERELRYKPDGKEFVIHNGDKRFTRAIYGTNTGFRFETSDFPEFGLYMPNLGGSVYMAISTPTEARWVKELESIESRFKPGQRTYILKDKNLLKSGTLTVDVVALSDGDGLVIRYTADQLPKGTKIQWVYGGANNKRYSREGDLGADPEDSFFIKPANCQGNVFEIANHQATVWYGHPAKVVSEFAHENSDESKKQTALKSQVFKDSKSIIATFPVGTNIREADGNQIDDLERLFKSEKSSRPVIIADYEIEAEPFYIELHNPKSHGPFAYSELADAFGQGVAYREKIASTLKLRTPDPYLNTLGGIFSGAEDAVWEDPGYLHGAIGWRMPLTGWRAAYLADLLGLHDRARTHFSGYMNSQVTNVPITLPHMQDDKLNQARAAKTWGTPMYSNGYICRSPNRTDIMHHYDMNLVFFDELLWHLNWTGDMDYAREIFPALQRHLAWEKNTFDPDNDGLYDGYCCIWASDALQYNGGKVTHSSAYNYRANKMAAEIARKLGEDPSRYVKEAEMIIEAMNRELWIPEKGWWAEFKDNMGHGMRHDNAAVWTIYHAIDSDIHNPFKAYQATRYIDTELTHIPVLAKGLEDTTNHVVATTNWQPYMWSINNVAFAEIVHTSLSYWQAGRPDEAFKLYKGALLDAMYLGSGPGNITQISFYDAARGETYRDFADPVSMGVRALVQGMYGIIPDLMNNRLTIRPGFPENWNFAEIETRNMAYSFKHEGSTDRYTIKPNLLKKNIRLSLEVKAPTNRVQSIRVNGRETAYELVGESVSVPRIRIDAGVAPAYEIEIEWAGEELNTEKVSVKIARGEVLHLELPFEAKKVYDPQSVLQGAQVRKGVLNGTVCAAEGNRTLFVQSFSGEMNFWLPVELEVVKPVEIFNYPDAELLVFNLVNYTNKSLAGELWVNGNNTGTVKIPAQGKTKHEFSSPVATLGTNKIEVRAGKTRHDLHATNWNIANPAEQEYRTVAMAGSFNEKVSDIFAYGKYLSPRWEYTTLQVPTQGMGQWCHPNDLSVIDDSGIRTVAAANGGTFTMPQGIPFATPGSAEAHNIAFTTLWDNYPASISLPLSGKASKAYFLVAASTYHMQAYLLNGQIRVSYADGTEDVLDLVLPNNLIPLDQDLFIDDWAFYTRQARPWRVRLKTGDVSKYHAGELGAHMSNDPIYVDGGMATLLDLPLDPEKELVSLTIETIANEVIIGLMGVTLKL